MAFRVTKIVLSAVSGLTSSKPVKHVVMFSLKQDATKAQHKQIRSTLLELPSKIPEIKDYEVGVDLLLKGGQTHPAGKNRGICWSASFDCQKDYETYDSSEAHQEFLAILKPLVEPGTRSAIQYEIESSTK